MTIRCEYLRDGLVREHSEDRSLVREEIRNALEPRRRRGRRDGPDRRQVPRAVLDARPVTSELSRPREVALRSARHRPGHPSWIVGERPRPRSKLGTKLRGWFGRRGLDQVGQVSTGEGCRLMSRVEQPEHRQLWESTGDRLDVLPPWRLGLEGRQHAERSTAVRQDQRHGPGGRPNVVHCAKVLGASFAISEPPEPRLRARRSTHGSSPCQAPRTSLARGARPSRAAPRAWR